MGRSLMVVRAHIGKAKLVLMNTHLESTGVRFFRFFFNFRILAHANATSSTSYF